MPTADNAPARPCTGCARRGRQRTVPTFTTRPVDGVGVQLCPSGIATTTPWAFTVASTRRESTPAKSSRPAIGRPVRTATQPISARLELVGRLRGFTLTGFSRTPSRLASRTRAVWQCPHVPALSEPLPTLTGVPRIRLLPASSGLPRHPGGGGLSPPPGHTAPRGAQCRPPTRTRSRCRPATVPGTSWPRPATGS